MAGKRKTTNGGDASGARREYQPDEVEQLTKRANDLLDELHSVLGEMSGKLRDFLGSEQP